MPERSQWSWTGLNTGLWAAVSSAVWSIWFIVAFSAWMSRLPAWTSIEAYAAAFDPVSYMAWVIPCFLLAITFPVLMTAVYLYLPTDRRAPALVALVLATLCGAVLGATYFVLGTVVRTALLAGNVVGLAWLVAGSPYSLMGALQGVGYLFMGLATSFVGVAWRVPGRWRRLVRWLLLVNGAVAVVGVACDVLGFITGLLLSLGLWAGSFSVVAILLALRFKQDLRVAPVSSRVIRV